MRLVGKEMGIPLNIYYSSAEIFPFKLVPFIVCVCLTDLNKLIQTAEADKYDTKIDRKTLKRLCEHLHRTSEAARMYFAIESKFYINCLCGTSLCIFSIVYSFRKVSP